MHRPGTSETFAEVVPAPADLGNALIGVPEGTDIDMNVRLESVVDGILVTGDAVVDVHGECSQPVCRETCQGLCSECGARLEENPGHHHEALDPRWSALQGLLGTGTEN